MNHIFANVKPFLNQNAFIEDLSSRLGFGRGKKRLLFRKLNKNPLTKELQSNIIKFIDSCKGKIWDVMNEIIRYSKKYGNNVYVSRKIIGERVGGLCEKQVTRITNKLCELGFIAKEYFRYKIGVGFRSLCKYTPNLFFKSATAKSMLSYFFPSLLAKSSLLNFTTETEEQSKCPSIYNKDIYNSSFSYLQIERGSRVNKKAYFDRRREREMRHQRICEENRAKNLEELLRNGEAPSKNFCKGVSEGDSQIQTPTFIGEERVPTIDDIPVKKMAQIEELPEGLKAKVIRNVLLGIRLRWKEEDENPER